MRIVPRLGEQTDIAALETAVARADQVANWRRGVVYADLSTELARRGRTDDARAMLATAMRYRDTIDGWQKDRISAHIAQAHAMLGDLDASRSLAAKVAQVDPRQYTARAAATVATGHAAKGEFDAAMLELAKYEGIEDFDISWWRTTGYVELAKSEKLSRTQRQKALDAARIVGLREVDVDQGGDLWQVLVSAQAAPGVDPEPTSPAPAQHLRGTGAQNLHRLFDVIRIAKEDGAAALRGDDRVDCVLQHEQAVRHAE